MQNDRYCLSGCFDRKEAILKLKKNRDKINPVKIIVKPRGNIGGGHGLYIVDDVEFFTKAKIECENAYGEAIIEEYIPGNVDSMRTVNLIFDKKSKIVAYFTTKKIRQWPHVGGISVLSISTDEWELVNMVLLFFRKWKWQEPAEVELKIDTRE